MTDHSMLDRIISFSLRNRLLIAAAAIVIAIAGSYVASRMEVDVFPDLNAPTVAVMTEAPGMATEEVEQTVTYPLETALNGVQGMRRLRSTSQSGFSVVWVEFDWGTDVYHARQMVSERIAGVDMPTGTGRPSMGAQTSVLGEVMFVGLTSDSLSGSELRTLADRRVAPRLAGLRGVAQVSVIGGDVKEYQILLDPVRMRRYGVAPGDVYAALEGMNVNATGGSVDDFGNEYIVRGVLSTRDASELGKAVVAPAAGDAPAVLLENIAEVTTGPRAPAMGRASVAGRNAVLLTVNKQPDTGTITLTGEIDKALAELAPTLPKSVELHTDLYRQQDFIDSSISNIKRSLVEGAVFVCIILFIFLMNPRTTLISIVTIPLSLIMTLLTLHIMGLTINTMSIGGIAIAIGSLVDDAIVDVENVYKRLRHNSQLPEGERRRKIDVVFDASREVRMPILNSTLIIIVSFIPLFFLQGMEGRMLVPLGVAFIISLVASTLVALTLTPVLCTWLLPEKGLKASEPKFVVKMKGAYSKALDFALGHKKGVAVGAAVLFAGALALFFTFGRSFLPPFNEGSFTINVSAFPGISLEESDRIGRQAEEILLSVKEIEKVARKTGRAELDEHALGVNVSEIEAPFRLTDRSKEEVADEIRHKMEALQGANVEIGQPISHRIDAMLSGTRANIAIKIFGPDLGKLQSAAKSVKESIEGIDGLVDVTVQQRAVRPQLRITPRRDILARYGMTLADFSKTVEMISGGVRVSEVYEDNLATDIVVKVDPRLAQGLEGVRNMPVVVAGGRVPLSTLAEISVADGPTEVGRENLERNTVVSVNVEGRDLRGAVADIRQAVERDVRLDDGYRIEYGGQFESEQRASRVLLLASLCSIAAIFLLLYGQFRSLSQSAAVMLNLPLALIGGVVAIALSSGVVSIPAIIGFISLFGIATRNGMLLVDRYNDLRRRGLGIVEAVRTGSADRLNPIVMTALTSALALIPLAAGGASPGNEIQSPMAKVILGGLITSTLLNGFVIPVVYVWNARREQRRPTPSRDNGNSEKM